VKHSTWVALDVASNVLLVVVVVLWVVSLVLFVEVLSG
jgi:hypothetical protein